MLSCVMGQRCALEMNLFRKKAVFNCIYSSERELKMHPVVESRLESRGDAKLLKKVEWPDSSMSKCPAFFMAGKLGFVLRSPISFEIRVFPDAQCEFRWPETDRPPRISPHNPEQSEPFFANHAIWKISSDLQIVENSGVPCFYHGAWQFNKDINSKFYVPSGFVDYKYNNCTNLFISIPIPRDGYNEVAIKTGDPLAQIVPITDKIVSLNHTVDKDFVGVNKVSSDKSPKISFYENEYTVRKRLIDQNEKMCPMHKLFRK